MGFLPWVEMTMIFWTDECKGKIMGRNRLCNFIGGGDILNLLVLVAKKIGVTSINILFSIPFLLSF